MMLMISTENLTKGTMIALANRMTNGNTAQNMLNGPHTSKIACVFMPQRMCNNEYICPIVTGIVGK